MTTFDAGREAESVAANYLRRQGCIVLEQNWRTRWCEIDLVAQRGRVIYFCEVKYRRTDLQGAGLDYITSKKLQQMRFAAESWVHMHSWLGEYQLCAIEVSGPDFQITSVIKEL